MFLFLKQVMSAIFGPGFVVAPLDFPLDIEKIARQLRLAQAGKRDGKKSVPQELDDGLRHAEWRACSMVKSVCKKYNKSADYFFAK